MSLPIHQASIPSWKKILRQNFTRLDRLTTFLELSEQQKNLLAPHSTFALNIPFRLAAKMKKGTVEDPLFRQFVPLIEEHSIHPGFELDPVNDSCFRKSDSSKMLHKYEGRVLIICTSACAMHCRYCFRQNFDYAVGEKTFAEEIHLIKQDPSIHEVILSGGDPLSLSDEILERLLLQLNTIPHVKRIRFHTRFPVGIPERIDENFLSLIQKIKKQIWFVIHVNHANELDADIFDVLHQLRLAGCVLLSQSVLLKGINDDTDSLKHLFELLVDHGIFPYYLHQLDRVQGAAHFEVEEQKGKWLIQEIAKSLPGYAVPKFVREIAGQPNKTPL